MKDQVRGLKVIGCKLARAATPRVRAIACRPTAAAFSAAALALLLSLAAPLTALAQAAAKASPELAACVAANRQGVNDLGAARDTEIRRHALHAVLVSRLQGLTPMLSQLRATVARNPRNLAECEQATQALAAAREQLERIVGSPDQINECTAANQAAYGEMQSGLLVLQSGGRVSVPQLEAAASRLDLLRPALTREGTTLSDCRQLSAEIATERAQLQRLVPAAAPPAPPARPAATAAAPAVAPAVCRQAHAREYNELAQAFARLAGGGPIAPEWMAPLQALSERLTKLHATIADPAAPGWDCEGIHRLLAQARTDLAQFVRR